MVMVMKPDAESQVTEHVIMSHISAWPVRLDSFELIVQKNWLNAIQINSNNLH